ncbi:RagB/SusD family nutrient uptake outer membrane protein [Chitinophaga barathri]|uniref:RagB/SusD family nutrient uptake outer membrane protein n=1 Tax=Chitinophaga barathri TaxID=1647451 RepID=A0A3N4M5N1_9BACT|nr:RagB/SusD family nutrient uptake outer membrane protein [Chitinophaga barathri]RPD38562.1 RagB/SusD family nutrient uptake outer membrane protein [Chitinophaga barathri]
MNFYKKISMLALTGFTLVSCTKLDEKLGSTLERSQADSVIQVASLLKTAYDGLQLPYQDQSNLWALQEMPSDEAVAPTRGGDWDDNGQWRSLKTHSWTAEHPIIGGTFTNLLLLQYSATNVLNFRPSKQQAAEARFLRALSMFSVLDAFGQVPFREPGEDLRQAPKVLKGAEAVSFIIAELTAIIPDLPERSASVAAYVANKDAARTLLIKTHLNKGAFLNPAQPTFDAADLTQVITLSDQIITSGRYSLANNYWDNLAYNNDEIGTENIFTQQNGPGFSTVRGGNAAFCHWAPTLHYHQTPGGWNGFSTVSDFYDKFEAVDTRRGGPYASVTPVTGLHVGMLVGQQFDKNGTALKDRKGNNLAFTRELSLQESGNDLEIKGIRVVKYPPDMVTPGGSNSNNGNNDWVFFRLADVMLMKAEALIRNGQAGLALPIVNELRAKRKATVLGAVTLDILLDERGRELYWEGWRRQDLIRFNKFLLPWQLKPTDNPRYLLFPIPVSDLAVNPNLKQNPGY